MVNSNTFLIKKGNSFIHRKRFSDRIVLNHLHENLKSVLIQNLNLPFGINTSNVLNIKTSIYTLQKEFQIYKLHALDAEKDFSLEGLDKFALKLQDSGFYTSTVELEKDHRLKQLKSKRSQFLLSCLMRKHKSTYQQRPLRKKEHMLNFDLFKPLQREELKKFYGSYLKQQSLTKLSRLRTPKFISRGLQQREVAKHRTKLSILRKNYNRWLESRVFSFFSTYKKKYRLISARRKTRKIQLKNILRYLKEVPLSFRKRKRYYYQKYKRLAWKRKKRKDRKKTGLLAFLRRRRRRLLFQFSVPRHFEMNYKTFELIHLGDFDLDTTNARIPYWLNLRRLLTFLSR